MKIGIIGSGEVGRVLATGFVNLKHDVKIGTRDPSKLSDWLNGTKRTSKSVGSFAEAAEFGEVVVVAVQGAYLEDALKAAGPENLAGKTVIDVTNPLDPEAGMPPRLLYGFNTSAGEKAQAMLPKSRVVKTLNIIGSGGMVNPRFRDGAPDMLLCGNDGEAKEQVIQILKDFGWKNITDIGMIEQSRIMEPMCIAWVIYAAKHGRWDHAFKMVK